MESDPPERDTAIVEKLEADLSRVQKQVECVLREGPVPPGKPLRSPADSDEEAEETE